MISKKITFLDCTLRDGGYYNDWDFSPELIREYLLAMAALRVNYVEIGFRSLKNEGFKGGCAFSTDSYLNSLKIPAELKGKIGVMLNGSELVPKSLDLMDEQAIQRHQITVLEKLFNAKKHSPVSLVRIACHVQEFATCLHAVDWLKQHGYKVGFNLMQVADYTEQDITQLAQLASQYPIDVLYFADSMGCLNPQQVSAIIKSFKRKWHGELGIHTHDNMGQAIVNSLKAVEEGVTWVDSTVTGMGRGPGNAQSEYLTIALEDYRAQNSNTTKLLGLVRKYFKPLQDQYGWGTNPYYYMAGKYGIHPSYIQEMLSDCRYSDEDMIEVIKHLKDEGGKKFSLGTLKAARFFYAGEARGTWQPVQSIQGKDVLIIGSGPGVAKHRSAIETYIQHYKPYVIALNTQKNIEENLIDVRAACHPVRLLADCQEYLKLPQPLVTPVSMLPEDVQQEFADKTILDFGLEIKPETFGFHMTHCTLPSSLVVAYALAIATSGKAKRILLAGFDGYPNSDPHNQEMIELFKIYSNTKYAVPTWALTQSQYQIPSVSVYGDLT